MEDEATLSRGDFTKCVEFHGHACPGLAIGFQAARTLMERLGTRKAPDEELVAIVETDACGADALQVMTGCTFGKGNFVFKNYGKHAFSLMDRRTGKGVRVCLRPDAFQADPNNEASAKEGGRFRELQQERIQRILDAEAEFLFKIEEISTDIPAKARIVGSGICDFCGEPTKIDLLRKINGRRLCIPCAHQQGLGDSLLSTGKCAKKLNKR